MEIQEKAIYTTGEVAQILKLSTITVGRKIRRGEIPATKIGKGYRMLGNDILEVFGWSDKKRTGMQKGLGQKITLKSFPGTIIGGLSRREIYEDR